MLWTSANGSCKTFAYEHNLSEFSYCSFCLHSLFFFLFDAIFKPTGVIQKQHSLCAGVNYRTWTVYCTKLFATVWQWFLFLSDSIWPVVPLCIWLSLFLCHNSLPWLIKSNLSLTTCNNRNELENHFMCLNSLEEVTSRVYFQFFQSTDIKNKSTTWQYKLNFTSSLYLLKYFKYLCRTPKHTTKVFWETVVLIWILLLFFAAPCNAEHQLVS